MGKAQSKRSLDITTEVKKDDVEEGSGKMEKIEDLDQLKPQINGDTHHTDNEATEKAGEEGTENEKDLSTEKEQKPHVEGGGDDGGVVASGENKTLENGDDETLNESKTTETTNAAESGDSNKKKKEKVKKKWSFRSISFGKKDKQKPPKKEEVVNGECEKVPEETTEDPAAAPKEQTKDEEKSETTSAAASPAEDKPASAQTEASKPEEKVESASVTNGNEPAKENTSETTAECKKTDVVEPPVSKDTEESTKEAAKPDEAPKESVTESPVATNIEVKDDVKTEIAVDKSAQKESQKGDGDSEVAQSPPPPLPSTPPPSQVMVFALSGTEKSSEAEQSQIPPPVTEQPVEKAPELPKSEKEPVIASSEDKAGEPAVVLTATEQVPSTEGAKLPTEEKKSEVEEIVTVQKVTEVSAESKTPQTGADSETIGEKKDAPITEEVKQKEGNVIPSEAPKDVSKAEDTSSAPAIEKEKTIALIDEVTKEAAVITQQKLESHTEPAVGEPETKKSTETSCNAPVPEDKTISPPTAPTVPENTSITDTQIPPVAAPSPIEESKESGKTVAKTEVIGDCKPSESVKEEKIPVTQTGSVESKPEQTEQKAEVSAGAEESKVATEHQIAGETKTESVNKPEPTLEGIKLETQQEPSQTPASKENGVGDHPPAVETASSDKQPDCKTVEVTDVAPQVDTTIPTPSDSVTADSGCGGGDGVEGGNVGGQVAN